MSCARSSRKKYHFPFRFPFGLSDFLIAVLLQCCSLPLCWKLFCVLKQEGTNAYRRHYTKDIGVEDMLSAKKWPSAIRGGDGGRHRVWEREEGQAGDCLLQRLAQLVLTTRTSASKQWEWDSRICNDEACIKKLLRIIGTRQVWPNCMWEMRARWQWARNASMWWLWQRIPHVLSLPCPCDTACRRLVLPSLFSHCPCLWYAYIALSVLVCLLQESWSSFSGILICHTSGREILSFGKSVHPVSHYCYRSSGQIQIVNLLLVPWV